MDLIKAMVAWAVIIYFGSLFYGYWTDIFTALGVILLIGMLGHHLFGLIEQNERNKRQ